jgi:hypothetical protein
MPQRSCSPNPKIGVVTADKKLTVKDSVAIDIDALVEPFKSTLHGI